MQADREDLCSRLVCKLLPVQADDSNHGLAMDYCLQNLEQHRFGDVDPASVESLYGGLSERLASHSQLQKQRALQKLVAALLACKLDSQQLEPHHNLLSLVYWLARRPLESAYIPSDEVSNSCAGSPNEVSEDDHLSDWGNDAAVYSSDSELSDWEDPRDTYAADTDSQSHSQAVQQTAADAEAQQSSSPLDLIKQLRQKLAVHLPKSQQMSRLHEGCLLLRVAAAQGSEDTLPPATHCTTEAELAQQVIRMLRAAGTDLLRLQTFVNKVQSAVSSQSWQASRAKSSVSPTLAAFAAALADQMHPMWAKLVEIEESLGIIETSIKVSLLHLDYQLQGVLRRIGLLKDVWEGALSTESHSRDRCVTAAQLSCDLLTKLKSMLHHYSLQGGAHGSQEVAVILRIWSQSMQPLLAALQAWLYDGLLQGSPDHFFICEDQNVSVDSPYFWNEAFTLQRTETGDIACPEFLHPLVEGILSTGKSVILLRAHQDLHTRTSATPASLQKAMQRKPTALPGSLQTGLTNLPAYSGRGMFSMSQQANSKGEEDRRWLQGLQDVDLPPVDFLLDECLIQPIQEQVDMVGGVLLARLLGEWGLMHQLTILHNVFLLGCPLLMPFASALFGRLHKGQTLSSLSHFELEVMLQQSLADQPPPRPGDHALPLPDTLSVELVHQNPSASMSRASSSVEEGARRTVAELLPLRLHYRVPWPLSMIVDDATLVKYNQVLTFLLQVRWAKWSLERVRVKAGRGEAGRSLEHGDVLAHQLSHFVNTLHQFVMDRLLHGAWLALEQALEGAKSLEEILNQVLHFADLQQKLRKPGTKVSVADARAELEALHAKFRDRHRYLLKVLTAKTLKISWQSELHYLVMRINFNDFHGKSDDLS
ncbi:hypothetical protein WJX79_003630 [Trebouxia sp. C0005]